MKIVMTRDTKASDNGILVTLYKKGRKYDVSEHLAGCLIENGSAKDATPKQAAPKKAAATTTKAVTATAEVKADTEDKADSDF